MKKKVLIVDDSPTMRRMIMATLQSLGDIGFIEAGNGLEAIEQLALSAVNLIILDLNMPDMHGLDVLKFIRNQLVYQKIPVVILTTRGDEASRTALFAAGASLYLTKPFHPSVLSSNVWELLNGKEVISEKR